MATERKKLNINRINLWVDIAILIAFLITTAPRFGGIAVHEWLSSAFGVAIVVHLLLHWGWIVRTVRKFFSALPRMTRINAILNIALFIDMTILMFSGFMISRVMLPLLGITPPPGFTWRGLHSLTSNIALLLIGLHIAVHLGWIVDMFNRHVLGRSLRSGVEEALAEAQS